MAKMDSMGALALRPPPAKASGISALRPQLRQRAEQAADTAFGTQIPVTEATRTEAANALAAFRAQTQPATEQGRAALASARGACLFRLADIVGLPEVLRDADPAQQAAFWAPYHDILAPIPVPVLERATRAFLAQPTGKGGKWFPDPGALLALANADPAWIEERRIAKGLDRIASSRPVGQRRPSTPEEDAEAWRVYEAKKAALLASIEADKAEVSQADHGRSDEIRETGSLLRRRA